MRAIKRAAEAAFLASGVRALARRRVRGRTLVLAYHNVVSDQVHESGDTSLHLPIIHFREHLDTIEGECRVIPLRDVEAPTLGDSRPRVILTFDDAYRGAVTHGVAELRRRSLPATIFVPPAYVPDRTFWWDDVARAGSGLGAALREEALHRWQGRDAEVRKQIPSVTDAGSAPDLRCATELELAAATRDGLITLGSHTWSHPNLAALPPDELEAELVPPLRWLQDRFPRATIPWVTYPYGLESPAVRAAARRAGYAGGFRVDGGWMPVAPLDPFGLPRFNVPAGLSADGLALRLSGLFA